jgi:hypothetical protein
VGGDTNDHAKLVYSRTDESGAFHVITKPFGSGEQQGVAPSPGCNDVRPSMSDGLILFARQGPTCSQSGLMLKVPGSAELTKVAGANFGADLNDGVAVWRASPQRLVARGVADSGELSPAKSLELPGNEAFLPPLVVENPYVYFVHKQGSDFIARTRLPLGSSPIEHYVQSKNDSGAEEAPHFGVTGTTLYITNYPQRNGDPGTRLVMQVRNPVFKPAK